MLLDAQLREGVDPAEAAAILGEAFDVTPHRLDANIHQTPFVTHRMPFAIADDATDLPSAGWTIRDGRLVGSVMIDNLTREMGTEYIDGVEISDMRPRSAILFAGLSRVIGGSDGLIVGGLCSEHNDCMGPLIRFEDRIVHCSSDARHPDETWYDERPHHDPIDRLPTDAIEMDDGDDVWCSIDTDRVEAWIAKRQLETTTQGALT